MDTSAGPTRTAPRAVLFDRDGTIVVDVPYNGDPALVQPVPGAREVLDGLRSRGIPVGVVTNQSGIARGLVTRDQVDAVNARVTVGVVSAGALLSGTNRGASLNTVSGDVVVDGLAGDLAVHAVSGTTTVRDLEGDLTVRTVSGTCLRSSASMPSGST